MNVRQDAQRRFYELRPEPLAEVSAWLEPYRLLWAGRLDALERHLDSTASVRAGSRRNPMDEPESADGTVRDGGMAWTCCVSSAKLAHPVERVWAALTEPEELIGWLGSVDIDPVEGGAVELRWLNTDEDTPSFTARSPSSRAPTPARDRLRPHVVEADERGHRLPAHLHEHDPVPNEYLALLLPGWHSHLDFLADALAGRPVDWDHWPLDHWKVLHERYVAALS